MSHPRTPEGLVLFEVYERSGALLVVTSDGTEARAACRADEGDRMFRRPWATASEPTALPPRTPQDATDAEVRAALASSPTTHPRAPSVGKAGEERGE